MAVVIGLPFQRHQAKLIAMRIALSLVIAILFVPVGYHLGFAAAYYLGDHGDVGSAFLAILSIPLGIVLSFVAAVISVAKLAGPQ